MPASTAPAMSSQRSFFLTNFFTALRQQTSSITAVSSQQSQPQPQHQPNKYQPSTGPIQPSPSSSSSSPAPLQQQHHHQPPPPVSSAHHHHHPSSSAAASSSSSARMATSPRPPAPLPIPPSRRDSRRGSDSSSEGFRDVLGADKWYIGGRTAGGEEKFFKLGVVRRVRSGDRLSLDRLSL